jgi:hypothetical protein
MAWNAIPYRFLSLADDSDRYTAAIQGSDTSHQRYIQERHLFGFFTNGVSLFESFFYAMFAIGGLICPADFSLTTDADKRKITPSNTRKLYEIAFKGDGILSAFDSVLDDDKYQQWKDIRNILSHRMAPGRQVFMTNAGKDTSSKWKPYDISLDDKLTTSRRAQAAAMLETLLKSAAVFSNMRIT